jgi:transposase InsO family protein
LWFTQESVNRLKLSIAGGVKKQTQVRNAGVPGPDPDLTRALLHAGLAVRALQMALSGRSWKAEGLIHHSDRGIQYASSDCTGLLEQGEIQISMSRRGNPYDNARAERFMRTLKEEEV